MIRDLILPIVAAASASGYIAISNAEKLYTRYGKAIDESLEGKYSFFESLKNNGRRVAMISLLLPLAGKKLLQTSEEKIANNKYLKPSTSEVQEKRRGQVATESALIGITGAVLTNVAVGSAIVNPLGAAVVGSVVVGTSIARGVQALGGWGYQSEEDKDSWWQKATQSMRLGKDYQHQTASEEPVQQVQQGPGPVTQQ